MQRHKKDHIGIWFEQRRKLGISDDILLAHYSSDTQKPTRYIYRHGHMDGISCLIHCFDQLGIKHKPAPVSYEKIEPDQKKFKLIKKNSIAYSKKINWRHWDENSIQEHDHLYTALFTVEQTQSIQQRAATENVSFNTLLFWALNKACAELLIKPGQNYSWLYPVNMRGAVDYGTPCSNYSSGFYVELNENTSLGELREKIRQKLKSGQHWVSWKEAKIAKYLPGFILRALYRYLSKRQFYAGSFSSLGEWETNTDSGWWYICAPGTANYPVSNCSLIHNGKLSCTLKLHKNISRSPADCKKVLERWTHHLAGHTHIKIIHSTL